VTDGEYEITVRWVLASNEEIIASAPRRVVVKGADVGGIELKVLPMGSITGKFALEATPGVCESKRKWSLELPRTAIAQRKLVREGYHHSCFDLRVREYQWGGGARRALGRHLAKWNYVESGREDNRCGRNHRRRRSRIERKGAYAY
jgi:hypothetical protein